MNIMSIGLWRPEEFTPRQSAKLRHEDARKPFQTTGGPFLVPHSWREPSPWLNMTMASKAVWTEHNLHTTECLQCLNKQLCTGHICP